MMKIVIAGTNGFAQFIAFYLSETTSHIVLFLSRAPNQGLQNRGWQVLPVSYQQQSSLAYSLKGTDIVISTISGQAQLNLIEAAAEAQVRLFIPCAFSGPQQCSPRDHQKPEWLSALRRLTHHQLTSSMRYTIFTCGIFYERFGPGGLSQSLISNANHPNFGIGAEGEFLVDFQQAKARVPLQADESEVYVCLTSARDTARYVVAVIQRMPNLETWPNEFKIFTERIRASSLVSLFAKVRGSGFTTSTYTAASLNSALSFAHAVRDLGKEQRLEQFIAAAEGAFDFTADEVNLTEQVLLDVRAIGAGNAFGAERFESWLNRVWSGSSARAATS